MNGLLNSNTMRLFKREPSFLGGIAALIFSPDAIRFSKTDDEADFKAIQSDWEAVGADMRNAIQLYGNATGAKQTSR
jgi:hypothetical protein